MEAKKGFAVWITGLPGSGKSTVACILETKLKKSGLPVKILESDELRRELFPHFSYEENDRQLFYSTLVYIGTALVENGINVIFDATANLRKFREEARSRIGQFIEVYLNCPLEECIKRDPKGIYAMATKGRATAVPGLQAHYEPPLTPEVTVDSTQETPDLGGERIFRAIIERFLKDD